MDALENEVEINSKIRNLPHDQRVKFEREFLDNVEDSGWCERNRVNYCLDEPSQIRALALTYNALFGN
jgi:hypothetical protein